MRSQSYKYDSGKEMSTLATSLVELDEDVCGRLARLLASQAIPEDREEIRFEGFDSIETGNLLLFVVAICHQTTIEGRKPLAGIVQGKLLRGWDFLLQRFVENARDNRRLLSPDYWETLSAAEIRVIYRNSQGEDLLTGLENRARLIADLGRVMKIQDWQSLQAIYEQCDGRISSDEPSVIECLGQFRAYSDPIRKKSFFLLSLMRNSGIWTYEDPENLGPPVDYHEVRGHLRIGTVRVLDESLKNKLLSRIPVTAEEDLAIRGAVLNAIMWLSEETGLRNPSQLHYMFWNIFRNYCTREEPNCWGERRESYLPDRYQRLAVIREGKAACPFSPVCKSVSSEVRFYEHVFETDYY